MNFLNANKLDRKSGGSPTIALNCLSSYIHSVLLSHPTKSNRKMHFRPRYALANLGHPSSSYWVLLGNGLPPGCGMDHTPPQRAPNDPRMGARASHCGQQGHSVWRFVFPLLDEVQDDYCLHRGCRLGIEFPIFHQIGLLATAAFRLHLHMPGGLPCVPPASHLIAANRTAPAHKRPWRRLHPSPVECI